MHNSAQRRVGLAMVAIAGLMALGALAAPVAAHAQGSSWPGRIEILPVRSQTLPLSAFLRGDKTGPEVLLGGELRLPAGVSGEHGGVLGSRARGALSLSLSSRTCSPEFNFNRAQAPCKEGNAACAGSELRQ